MGWDSGAGGGGAATVVDRLGLLGVELAAPVMDLTMAGTQATKCGTKLRLSALAREEVAGHGEVLAQLRRADPGAEVVGGVEPGVHVGEVVLRRVAKARGRGQQLRVAARRVRREPDPVDLADAFFSLAHRLKRTVNGRVQDTGLSMARLRVLYQLSAQDGLRIGELVLDLRGLTFMDVLGQHNGFTAVSHIEHITAHQLIEQTTFTVIVFTDYGHRWRHVQLQENAQTIQIPAALWQHGQHRLQYLIKG